MRENIGLFRGKRIDNNEWVEGYYTVGRVSGDCTIESKERNYIVDPNSIGECVGIPDANGNRVFEGHILEVVRNKEKWVCVVEDIRNLPPVMFGSAVESIKIIGNIHDNPELLKEGVDE